MQYHRQNCYQDIYQILKYHFYEEKYPHVGKEQAPQTTDFKTYVLVGIWDLQNFKWKVQG